MKFPGIKKYTDNEEAPTECKYFSFVYDWSLNEFHCIFKIKFNFKSGKILNLLFVDENAFSCDECGRKFRLQQQLTEHKFIHKKTRIDDNMEVKCEQCDKMYVNFCWNQIWFDEVLCLL